MTQSVLLTVVVQRTQASFYTLIKHIQQYLTITAHNS